MCTLLLDKVVQHISQKTFKLKIAQKRFLGNRKRKVNLRKRTEKQFHGDYFLYKLNPPLIPKKVQEGVAEIPDVLTEPPEKEYRGREFGEPLTEEELMWDDKEAIKAKWSDREKEHYLYLFAKSLLIGTKKRTKLSFWRKNFQISQEAI